MWQQCARTQSIPRVRCPHQSVHISSRCVASASADTLKTPPVAVRSQGGGTHVVCQQSPRAGTSAVATSACRGADDDLVTVGMAWSGRAVCSVTSGQPACCDSCKLRCLHTATAQMGATHLGRVDRHAWRQSRCLYVRCCVCTCVSGLPKPLVGSPLRAVFL